MERVFIIDGLRTPIGLKNGFLKNIPADFLGAYVLDELISRHPNLPIDEVIGGNTVGNGGNLMRLTALRTKLSKDVPAYTIDMQCSSSLMCLENAFAKIRSGLCHCILAGGMESSSMQAKRFFHPSDPRNAKAPNGYMCSQFSPDYFAEDAMLRGAENTANLFDFSKDALDILAFQSHSKAQIAKEQKTLSTWILPLNGHNQDEGLRRKISHRLLQRTPPLFDGGKTTAANACSINDGAAFLLICSESISKKYSLTPLAEIIETASVGGDPALSPIYAQKAADKILQKSNLKYNEIDAFEFNESFAVIDALFKRENPNLMNRYNRFGGALAYGHPYGATGAILTIHLLQSLKSCEGNYGICAVPTAGGLGCALLIKNKEG